MTAAMARALRDSPDGAVVTVHVQPNAARTEYAGVQGEALKFRVAAPPIEGAANEALCAFLAERLGIPRSAVAVRAGQGSRRKRVLLKGIRGQRVWEVFAATPV